MCVQNVWTCWDSHQNISMFPIHKVKQTQRFSKACLFLKRIHQKWESGHDLMSAINRWLISISKSVVKLWNDRNSAKQYLTGLFFLCFSPAFDQPVKHYSDGSLIAWELFTERHNLWLCACGKTHRRATQFTSPFHTPCSSSPAHTFPSRFAGSLLPLWFGLFIWLSFYYISFQSAKFPWHSWVMCHHWLQPEPVHTHTYLHIFVFTH